MISQTTSVMGLANMCQAGLRRASVTKVNMHEAKTNFSKLVELALQGEEVVIARSGTPMVKLVPVAGPNALRPIGLDHQEVDEAFLEESLGPLERDDAEAFFRPDLLNG